MSIEPKRQMNSSEFEVDSHDIDLQSKLKTLRRLEGARTSLTILALLAGITILATSADALAVYEATHVSSDFLLPLWSDSFNLRPTVALVIGSSIVIAANAVGLVFSKAKVLRSQAIAHTGATFAVPAVGLTAAIIAIAFFYVVNASDEVDTIQSWSCRWRDVAMMTRPHFGTLCKQSQAGLALTIFLIPLEAIILGVAAYELAVQRLANSMNLRRKSASPGHNQL